MLQELISSGEKINEHLISECIFQKNKLVNKDPNEKNIRKILNYGHSIGHALESLFLDKSLGILHGQAIATGMIVENHISFQLGCMIEKDLNNL
mgnify:CR=1 FL=1